MKIVFVLEHFYPYVGGAEKLFFDLATALVKQNHSVTVLTTKYKSSLRDSEVIEGVKVKRINCYNRYLFTIFGIPYAIKLAADADVVHTTSYNSALPASLAGFFRRKKVIITFHEVWGKLWFDMPFIPAWKRTIFYLYEQFILHLPFSKYVAVSKSTSNSLRSNGIDFSRIILIYNGISYDDFSGYRHQAPAEFTFCYFGRLGISKGLDILIKGTAIYFSESPQSKLKLIIPTYPKPLFKKIEALLHHYNIRSNVVLFNNLTVNELFNEVSSSSCVIIPSLSEGFCYVAAEAAAMGVPILTSARGSLPEVVSGNFIQIDNLNPEGIKKALVRASMADWDYKSIKKFPLETSVKKYLKLYEDLR